MNRLLILTPLMIFAFNLFASTSVLATADLEVERPYSIRPYTIRASDKRIQVKFQLARDAVIDINVLKTNRNTGTTKQHSFQKSFNQGVVQTLDIGKQPCDTEMEYEIRARYGLDAGENEVEETTKTSKLKSFPCDVNKDITFAFLTDTHAGYPGADRKIRQITKAMNRRTMNESLAFVLNAGDFVPNGAEFAFWHKFFDFGSSYSNAIPLITAIGNHDYGPKGDEDEDEGEGESKFLELPTFFDSFLRWDNRNDDGNELFSFPQFDLIVLNSNVSFLADRMVQVDWFREKLIQAKKKNKFVIVCLHHSVFSTGSVAASGNGNLSKQLFVPLIQEYKSIVKLVLTGHIHMYERSVVDGVNYVVGGPSGGRKHSWFTRPNPYKVFLDKLSTTFSVVKVSKNSVSLKTYNRRNRLIDEVVVP